MPGEYTSWHGKTRTELFNHLMDHKDRGDKVPFSAIHRIGMELANIPEEHWNQELVILMNKLSSSNGTLKQFLDMYRVNHRKQVKHLLEELFAVIANLDDLDWPEDDD
jgi:GTPase involved in cell partitioning and DNA repair